MDTIIQAGTYAPNFNLLDLEGKPAKLEDWKGKIIVINFWSAECPWAERADREMFPYLMGLQDEVTWVSIASNANEDTELLALVAGERNLPLLLVDPQQLVADLYGAQTTPHIYVVDQEGVLRYQGGYDDTTFRQRTATRNYMREVVDSLLSGHQPPVEQTAPYGCTIVRHAP